MSFMNGTEWDARDAWHYLNGKAMTLTSLVEIAWQLDHTRQQLAALGIQRRLSAMPDDGIKERETELAK